MPSSFLDGQSPAGLLQLGLPEKFPSYRDVQREITEFCLLGPHGDGSALRRFRCVGAPPGCGKSLAEATVAELTEGGVVILTATRALEDQLVSDAFPLINVRGRNNYECRDHLPASGERWSCEEGDERDCKYVDTVHCAYRAKVEEARQAKIKLTNYSYWMHARQNNQGALETTARPIRMLICDECHLAHDQLASFLRVYVSTYDLHSYARVEVRAARGRTKETWGFIDEKWLEALGTMIGRVDVRRADIAGEWGSAMRASRKSKEYRKLEKLVAGLSRLIRINTVELNDETRNWIWKDEEHGVSFECVWPRRYAERYLWSGVETVVLMSATLRPKAMQLLGIKQTDYHFKEWPRQFPALRSPVYWLPTGKMGYKASQEEIQKAVRQGERIFEVWKEHKGLVHTASYRRAEWLQAASGWGRWMVLNAKGESASEAAERFKQMDAPAALVSPSYTTGHDFSDNAARWNWIVKLPFPDRSDPVMLARCETDDQYYDYTTAQTLVQACGRVQRNDRDWGCTLITDDAIGRFRNYARQHFPQWFKVLDVPGEPGKQTVPGLPVVVRKELGL